MNKNYTEIVVVMDRSGSMQTIRSDMEGGLNKFFDDQKKIHGKCICSLFQFDGFYEPVFQAQNVTDVPPITLQPRGATALLDAIGKTIDSVGFRLKNMPEAQRPEKVVFVIVTDGQENSSREFTKPQVTEMIKLQQDTYKWQFIYLGAGHDAITEATAIGIYANNAMTFSHTGEGSRGSTQCLSDNVGSYRTGATMDASFSAPQKLFQEELLLKHGK